MKKFITILLTCFVLCSAGAVHAQQVGLTLTPQGTQPYATGSSFQVFANYNYSNITGNIEVVITYNPTIVSFCGSASFPYPYVSNSVNATTQTITYTFPAASGNNQTGVIMMCFSFLCPQTCTGTAINSAINGSINAPSSTVLANAPPAGISSIVNNTWTGQHTFFSFIQSSYEVTFRIIVYGSSCFQINNPSFVVNPSIGTLVSASNATISGNTITPVISSFYTGSYVYYYTVKIPCSTPAGTVITSSAVLKGTNCGVTNSTIYTLPSASYTLPVVVASNPSAQLSAVSNSGYLYNTITNNGNTPLNLQLTNTYPAVKVNSVYFSSTTQSAGVTANVTYYDCSNSPSTTYPLLPGSSNNTPPLYVTKATIAINNLLPGHTAYFYTFYDLSNSCSGVPNQSTYTFISNLTFDCNTSNLSQVCYNCTPGTGTIHDTAVYVLKPNINCISQSALTGCFNPGDTVNICLRFMNTGETALNSGALQYNLPAFLTFLPGSETFTGFSSNPVYQSSTNAKWNLPTIPTGNATYDICFKATVNSNAPYGSYNMNYNVTGTNYSSGNLGCPYVINICALPRAEVEKAVKGNLDATFSSTGNGYPGSTAIYQITVKNTGNTPIGNIVLIDRMPFVGDATIMTCTPRNSQFSLFPTAALTIPGATVTYSSVSNIATGWPTVATSCANTGSFSGSFQPNSIKISLTNPIPAGGSYTFTFPVTVPTNATPGQQACNTIGMICDLVANNNSTSVMNPVESNNVCLTVQQQEVPPPPCTPCKEVLKSVSASLGQLQADTTHQVQQATIQVTTSKALQELRISVADINYTWESKGCSNCNTPVIGRGCLFPQSSTQTIGGLVWDNYANATLPPNASGNQCLEELVWKLGTQAPAGSYQIPVLLTLPVPTVPECCRLRINAICFRVTFKDKDCNTCDTVICVSTNTTPGTGGTDSVDCCKESHFTGNSISWKTIATPIPNPDISLSQASKAIIVPSLANSMQITCNETYTLYVNTSYVFNSTFQCASPDCTKKIVLRITGPGGNFIQTLTGSGIPYTFTQAGTYYITYAAYCGDKLCATCRYTLNIKKKGLTAEPATPIGTTIYK
ncbi:conserved repeat domain-containing protein [Filimonas lacunae]|uniref:Conserved repeat domain-containing protein n=1 Tax=Filimonas lacunae TaxID=477680 RepID=A0A173MDY6_9BACT|nr:hypothetical protein [Filimonas lacunae]BAV05785.1 hypothetical protein FLA_1797 [Filimonas lacunae]SIT28636.1 conserved repeat domain-containing protein [Filimonas lacunae]